MNNAKPRLSQRASYQARYRPHRSSPEGRGPSAESAAPIIGCAGCLTVIGIAVVDILPFLRIEAALGSGRHALAAAALIAVIGLGTGPVVAGLVGYVSFRSRDRVLAALEARWPGLTERDNAAALNPREATFVVSLTIALGAGAGVGSAVVAVLNLLLP